MSTVYVRSPVRRTVDDIIRNDPERTFLSAKLRDPDFYTNSVRWFDGTRTTLLTAENIDGFLYEWESKSRAIRAK